MTNAEFIDKIHELLLLDRRISSKSIAEQLGISRERIGSIIHEDLDMRKLSAKWVPKRLNADQKVNVASRLSKFWIYFRRDPYDLLSRLMTMDETWLYQYGPETKQQSMEWRHSGSPRRKISDCKNPLEIFRRDFWDQDEILLIDYLPKGQTINTEYYSFLLVLLKDILKEKHSGNFTKVSLFLHQNAPPHWARATQKKLSLWTSSVLITHPILWMWPRRTTTCSSD